MTSPAVPAPAVVARSRASVGAVTESAGLPVLVVGLALCLAGYAAAGWWLLQVLLGLFA